MDPEFLKTSGPLGASESGQIDWHRSLVLNPEFGTNFCHPPSRGRRFRVWVLGLGLGFGVWGCFIVSEGLWEEGRSVPRSGANISPPKDAAFSIMPSGLVKFCSHEAVISCFSFSFLRGACVGRELGG